MATGTTTTGSTCKICSGRKVTASGKPCVCRGGTQTRPKLGSMDRAKQIGVSFVTLPVDRWVDISGDVHQDQAEKAVAKLLKKVNKRLTGEKLEMTQLEEAVVDGEISWRARVVGNIDLPTPGGLRPVAALRMPAGKDAEDEQTAVTTQVFPGSDPDDKDMTEYLQSVAQEGDRSCAMCGTERLRTHLLVVRNTDDEYMTVGGACAKKLYPSGVNSPQALSNYLEDTQWVTSSDGYSIGGFPSAERIPREQAVDMAVRWFNSSDNTSKWAQRHAGSMIADTYNDESPGTPHADTATVVEFCRDFNPVAKNPEDARWLNDWAGNIRRVFNKDVTHLGRKQIGLMMSAVGAYYREQEKQEKDTAKSEADRKFQEIIGGETKWAHQDWHGRQKWKTPKRFTVVNARQPVSEQYGARTIVQVVDPDDPERRIIEISKSNTYMSGFAEQYKAPADLANPDDPDDPDYGLQILPGESIWLGAGTAKNINSWNPKKGYEDPEHPVTALQRIAEPVWD